MLYPKIGIRPVIDGRWGGVRESLEKPIYKEKLRLRSYGVPKKEDIVFVEMMRYIMCWRATHRFVPIRTSYSAVRNCRLKRHTP